MEFYWRVLYFFLIWLHLVFDYWIQTDRLQLSAIYGLRHNFEARLRKKLPVKSELQESRTIALKKIKNHLIIGYGNSDKFSFLLAVHKYTQILLFPIHTYSGAPSWIIPFAGSLNAESTVILFKAEGV